MTESTMMTAEVICMEDEDSDALTLEEQFDLLGGLRRKILFVKSVEELQASLIGAGHGSRVVILDWLIGQKQQGILALQIVKKLLPFASSIVFTRFGNDSAIKEIAHREGADYFLAKDRVGSGVWERLYRLVSEGKALSVLRELSVSTVVTDSAQKFGLPLDVDCPHFANLILKHWDSADEKIRGIAWEFVDALEKLESWETIDTEQFSEMVFTSQLKSLVANSKLTWEQLGAFLGKDLGVILESDLETNELGSSDRELLAIFDVLWRTMRRARYSPELYRQLLAQPNCYRLSEIRPPWDDVGIADYITSGVDQLHSAAEWMRTID